MPHGFIKDTDHVAAGDFVAVDHEHRLGGIAMVGSRIWTKAKTNPASAAQDVIRAAAQTGDRLTREARYVRACEDARHINSKPV